MKQNWKEEIENMERKRNQEIAAGIEKENIKFVKVGEQKYRVFNKKTNRFHDLKLGIDMVT